MTAATPEEFHGCNRDCRMQQEHTLRWGDCEHGVQLAPVLSYAHSFIADDGELSVGFDSLPLGLFAPWSVYLPVAEQHEMLAELAEADPTSRVSVLAAWRTTAEQLSDPVRREVLLGEFSPADYIEADRPMPVAGAADGRNDAAGPMSDAVLAEIAAELDDSCVVDTCADPCTNRTVTPWQARAMLDEIRRLRALVGDPIETEVRFLLSDGGESIYDLHNGPCDCERESRNIYAGPWLPAGGWATVDSPPLIDSRTSHCFHLPSRAQVEQQASGLTFEFSPRAFTEEDFAKLRRSIRWDPNAAKDVHAKWSDTRTARLDDPDARAGYDAAEREYRDPGGEIRLRRRSPAESLAYYEARRAEWVKAGKPAAQIEAIDLFIADAKQVAARNIEEPDA